MMLWHNCFLNYGKVGWDNYSRVQGTGYNMIIVPGDKIMMLSVETKENINSPSMWEVLQVVYLHFPHLDVHQSNIICEPNWSKSLLKCSKAVLLPYSSITFKTISLGNPIPTKWSNTLELDEPADELALRGEKRIWC